MFAKLFTFNHFFRINQEQIPLIRYAFGASLLMAISMAFAWDMAYLTPVLSLSFIAPGATVPSLKKGLGFVIIIAITTFVGFVFTKYFIHMKLVFIPIQALALFSTFYTNKISAPIKLFIIVAIIVIPILGMQSISIAYAFMKTFISGAFITILLVWLIFALFPDKETLDISGPKNLKEKPSTSLVDQYNKAKQTFLIVFPIILLFFIFEWMGSILVLIFIAILSMQVNFNMKSGFAMIMGNLAGGILAIVAYETLTMVPFFPMLIFLTALVSLLCASKLFSDSKLAPLFGMGFSTFLLIMGQSLTSTDNASEKVWLRVIQIMLAVSYVVIAFAVSNAFKQRRITNKKILLNE